MSPITIFYKICILQIKQYGQVKREEVYPLKEKVLARCTDGKAAALYPEDQGLNPVVDMKNNHAPCCSMPYAIVVYKIPMHTVRAN